MAIDPGKNQGDDALSDSGFEEEPPESELDAELDVLADEDEQ